MFDNAIGREDVHPQQQKGGNPLGYNLHTIGLNNVFVLVMTIIL